MIVNNQWKRCTTFQPSNRMIFFYSFIFLFLVTQFLQVKASLSPRLFIQPFNNIRWHKVIRAKIITLDSSSSSALTLPCTRRRNRGNSPWLAPPPLATLSWKLERARNSTTFDRSHRVLIIVGFIIERGGLNRAAIK